MHWGSRILFRIKLFRQYHQFRQIGNFQMDDVSKSVKVSQIRLYIRCPPTHTPMQKWIFWFLKLYNLSYSDTLFIRWVQNSKNPGIQPKDKIVSQN